MGLVERAWGRARRSSCSRGTWEITEGGSERCCHSLCHASYVPPGTASSPRSGPALPSGLPQNTGYRVHVSYCHVYRHSRHIDIMIDMWSTLYCHVRPVHSSSELNMSLRCRERGKRNSEATPHVARWSLVQCKYRDT